MAGKKKVGVVLFQLGGPDSLEAVEPFLYNLFCDPDIIPLGPLGVVLRRPMAKLISMRRARPVARRYAEIGGRSPIRALTERQRDRLGVALAPLLEATVVIAMRYWHPFASEAVETLNRAGPLDEIVLLPLYPHYSFATTLSSLKEWRRVYGQPRNGRPQHLIEHFHDHPLYIQALIEKIAPLLRQFPDSSRAQLVFSAHGLPVSLVQKGDPYPCQVKETVRLVCERGVAQVAGWPRSHVLCSFVTEHIETLHEINIEAREEAERRGVKIFRMMPAVGDSPLFISALADLVLRALGLPQGSAVSSLTAASLP